mmetsp:Transcript_24369/g.35758  ORF Transcript_24369/g.35758 Transcript_24369/m.35758 type:complete len:117 (-) Transcript_24369:46-396(-)
MQSSVHSEVVADDDEFEEVMVYVDFTDFDDARFLDRADSIVIRDYMHKHPTCTVVSDSKEFTFRGEHAVSIGTCHFYTADTDPNSESSSGVRHVGSSNRKTNFKLTKFGAANDSQK